MLYSFKAYMLVKYALRVIFAHFIAHNVMPA
jgi:hypothetical protein